MWKIFCPGHILSTAGDALSVFNIIIIIIYTYTHKHIHTYMFQQGERENPFMQWTNLEGLYMVSEKVGFLVQYKKRLLEEWIVTQGSYVH
jgi:hypothetical protein